MEGERLLSCTPCTPDRLLSAYRKRDLPGFIALLGDAAAASACLRLAAGDHDVEAYVAALLDADVDPNEVDRKTYRSALMLAAEANNVEVLRMLMEAERHPPDFSVLPPTGDTILHLAVKKKEKPEIQAQCVKMILQNKKVDFLNRLNKAGHSAVLICSRSYSLDQSFLAVLRVFLEHPAIDLDSAKYMGSGPSSGTARDILARVQGEAITLPPPVQDRRVDEDVLIRMLSYGEDQVQEFCDKVSEGGYNLDYDNGSHTMLQLACSRGHLNAVLALLKLGADVTATSRNNSCTPVCLASARAHADILRALLDKSDVIEAGTEEGDTALMQLTRSWSSSEDHEDCLQQLLTLVRSRSLDINHANIYSNTALHHATDRHLVLQLLQHGAYIGGENSKSRLPLATISRELLEEHLSDCVVSRGQPLDDDYEITFDYSCLVPPGKPAQPESSSKTYLEMGSKRTEVKEAPSETAPLLYMSANADLRPLLKHPLVTSFLELKWQRLSWIFGLNLACFIFFVLFFTLHILWVNERHHTGLNGNSTGVPSSPSSHSRLPITLLAAIFWLLLVLRELFQLLVSPHTYFTANRENLLEIALICSSGYTLILHGDDSSLMRFFAADTILLSWGELIVLIGRHPFFATYFEMLKRVTWNFFKFLAWYSILIIAFALSFYALFRDSDEKDNLFAHPVSSVFKTVVMMTGEFDLSDIPFVEFPWFSHGVFVVFVFLIAIVLLNLLNGLAVSDTQAIKDDAELVGYVSRVKLVHSIERMVLGQSNRPCTHWLRSHWLVRRVTLFQQSMSYVGIARPHPRPVLSLRLAQQKDGDDPMVQCRLARDIIRAAEDVIARKSRPTDMETLRKTVKSNEDRLIFLETHSREMEKMMTRLIEQVAKK